MAEWADWEVEILQEGVKAGETYSSIARRLDGKTKNAAIGKALRMKLRYRAQKPKPKKPITPKKQSTRISAFNPPVLLKPRAVVPPKPDAFVIGPGSKTLMELEPHECRWPVNNGENVHRFCAMAKAAGSSYCEHHKELSLNPRRA